MGEQRVRDGVDRLRRKQGTGAVEVARRHRVPYAPGQAGAPRLKIGILRLRHAAPVA